MKKARRSRSADSTVALLSRSLVRALTASRSLALKATACSRWNRLKSRLFVLSSNRVRDFATQSIVAESRAPASQIAEVLPLDDLIFRVGLRHVQPRSATGQLREGVVRPVIGTEAAWGR